MLSGNLNEETEYVSLNELPCNNVHESNLCEDVKSKNVVAPKSSVLPLAAAAAATVAATTTTCTATEGSRRVMLDAHGKIIYNSDSLKRRKAAHTTFVPGPCIKSPAVTNEESTTPDGVSSASSQHQQLTIGSLRPLVQVKPVKVTSSEPTKMTTQTGTYGSTAHFIDPGKSVGPNRSIDLNKRRANCVNNSGAVVKRSNSYRLANISPPISFKNNFTFDDDIRNSQIDNNVVWSPKNKLYTNDISRPIPGSLVKIRRSKTDEGFVEDNSSDESLNASFEQLLQKLCISSTLNLEQILNSTTIKEAKSTDDLEKLKRLIEESENDSKQEDQLKPIDESDDEVPFYSPTKVVENPIYLTPHRVTIPKDSQEHRARFLQRKASDSSTDIW